MNGLFKGWDGLQRKYKALLTAKIFAAGRFMEKASL